LLSVDATETVAAPERGQSQEVFQLKQALKIAEEVGWHAPRTLVAETKTLKRIPFELIVCVVTEMLEIWPSLRRTQTAAGLRTLAAHKDAALERERALLREAHASAFAAREAHNTEMHALRQQLDALSVRSQPAGPSAQWAPVREKEIDELVQKVRDTEARLAAGVWRRKEEYASCNVLDGEHDAALPLSKDRCRKLRLVRKADRSPRRRWRHWRTYARSKTKRHPRSHASSVRLEERQMNCGRRGTHKVTRSARRWPWQQQFRKRETVCAEQRTRCVCVCVCVCECVRA
jgi:hypothetical protein